MEATTTYPEIINLFLPTEGFRPQITKPHAEGGFVYATNGHVLLRIPHKYYPEVAAQSKFPDAAKLMQYALDNNYDTGLVEDRSLALIVEQLPKKTVFKSCQECEGEGKIDCECCGHTNDCGECYGLGKTDEVIGEAIVPDFGIAVGNQVFSGLYIDVLFKAMLILKANTATFFESQQLQKAGLFKIKEALILIMPLAKPEAKDAPIRLILNKS